MTSPPLLPLILVRPQPGLDRSVAAARALGLTVIAAPLFATVPLAWDVPDDGTAHDALLLTSANAVRLAGPGLAALSRLPVWCVGPHTAAAARAAGLNVVHVGAADGAAVLAAMDHAGVRRPLWLAGRDHRPLMWQGAPLAALCSYAAESVPPPEDWTAAIAAPAVVAVHSPRAAMRAAELAGSRVKHLKLAAISAAALGAAGEGWADCAVAAQPRDAALLELARRMCQTGADQQG